MVHPLIPKVQETIHSGPVVIFMKGTPDFPACGFSARAVQVLRAAGAEKVVGVDVLADDALWDALEEHTKWPTIPQVFVNGEFVGGCDIVSEMYERGELQALIQKKPA